MKLVVFCQSNSALVLAMKFHNECRICAFDYRRHVGDDTLEPLKLLGGIAETNILSFCGGKGNHLLLPA
jgi:hypothetical protein